MTGTKKFKEIETEKERGKKRYLERKIQEREADKDIHNYKEEKPNFPERQDDSRQRD